MAAGDSWADPIIVDNWADFLTNNQSSKYVKFANPSRTITGDGSSGNPYVVSTYDEMLTKTGATYIYQVKLIDREAKKYRYGDIYCIYDDSLTTIDFEHEPTMPEGGYTNSLEIDAHTDFNGWTLKNMQFNKSALRLYNRNKNLRLLNLRLLGYLNSSMFYCDDGLEDSIINLFATNDSNSSFTVLHSSSDNSRSFTNCSFVIKTDGAVSLEGTYNNCVVDLDATHFSNNTGLQSMVMRNTLVTGKISNNATSLVTLFGTTVNCIFDFDWEGTKNPQKTSNVSAPSFFNSEKMPSGNLAATNLYAATTAQLKDAQWLYDRGFPIGVD